MKKFDKGPTALFFFAHSYVGITYPEKDHPNIVLWHYHTIAYHSTGRGIPGVWYRIQAMARFDVGSFIQGSDVYHTTFEDTSLSILLPSHSSNPPYRSVRGRARAISQRYSAIAQAVAGGIAGSPSMSCHLLRFCGFICLHTYNIA